MSESPAVAADPASEPAGPGGTRRWAVAALLLVLATQAILTAVLVRAHIAHRALVLEGATVPLFGAALILIAVARLPVRAAVLTVILTGAVLQACAVSGFPISSDDDYRYMWDAKVQLSGTDPYRYPPSAPQLAPLRDGFLFPAAHCNHFPGGCTRMSRPTGRTIYPPVAQLAFDVIRIASFGGRGHHVPLEIAAALGAIAVSLLLARRAPPWQVAIWAWCPLTVVEFANNAHIDWLGVLFAVAALQAAARRRPGWAGVLVGLATAVKLYPALVGASMLRRRPLAVIGAAAGVFALTYVPHVLAVGTDVIGYLPTYLQEEHYESGGRFLLFHGILSATATQWLVLVLLAIAALAVVARSDPDHPERGATVLLAIVFALVAPEQSWYAALFVALIAMTGWIELLPLALCTTLSYLSDAYHGLDLTRDARILRYGVALSLLAMAVRAVVRRRRAVVTT